jgi:hypothetical protein
LGIREIKNLCEVLQVPEHKLVRFFLGVRVTPGHIAGRRLRENDAGSECGDCGVSYQCMSHKSLPVSYQHDIIVRDFRCPILAPASICADTWA